MQIQSVKCFRQRLWDHMGRACTQSWEYREGFPEKVLLTLNLSYEEEFSQ